MRSIETYPSKWIFCFLWDYSFSFSFCYCLIVFYPNTGIFCDNSSICFLRRITLCFNREAVMILRPSIKGIYKQKCPFVVYHIWWYLFLSPIWLLFARWIGFLKHKNIYIFFFVISRHRYGACTWNRSPRNTSSQGISSHGIGPVLRKYSCLSRRQG